ncbi:hypothetical protein A2442_00875 [Candidatus Campbellbacteria bacterium RIFOXYC2_FULL_35_25]|uniref:Uncharacterized protein n=1 Tax=Candidatus Campbellbacteria bacterium RIFOXYC2_FULL_35_25 TaxID=1797582 RepID=A0A1F5EIV4_9BACT|nr:MAG: hypothetical protein A2442_00875 [Candidatus Campbellbacteria bacterium RIFOXYC2_FULL_35_25]
MRGFFCTLRKLDKMINLLPEEKKKTIFYEFILRLIIVFFFFSFFSICVAFILLMPSYFLSNFKESDAITKISLLQKANGEKDEDFYRNILINEKIKLDLLNKKNEIDASEIINEIVVTKPENVEIRSFFYEKKDESKTEKGSITLVVNGVAQKRSTLIDFVNLLKENNNFVEIDFPVSSLVKDDEVDFSLKILVKANYE